MKIIEHASLKDILWYKIGGTARYLLEISSGKDMEEAITFLQEKDLYKEKKYFVIGYGSNLIFAKEHFEGAVIQFLKNSEDKGFAFDPETNQVTVFAGESLDSLIQFGFSHQLIGLEWAGGLPGTVGAAVRGNVGAYGGEMKDVFDHAEVIKLQHDKHEWVTVANDDMHFSYRESIIKQQRHFFVVNATFQLQRATAEELERAKEVYREKIQHRKDRHPLEYPNCGSVFKNIKDPDQIEKVLTVYPEMKDDVEKKWYGKVSAAALIERLGLKGYQVGGAQVSEKHALFIVNKGNAKAQDVLTIIDTIQTKFQETFGFTLELEVEIVR